MEIALEFELSGLANPLAKISGVRATVLPKPDQIEGQITVDALLTTARSKDHLPKIVDHCQGLKWIHVLGTGVDSFPFDLMNDMRLTCSRGATAIPISEWVLAMMLAHEKQLPARLISEPPDAWYIADLGTLENKTLGIVGFGAIGQAVAKRALAFDMNVIAKVRHHRESPPPNVELVGDLTTLLSRADHVVLALPATLETHHIINAKTLKAMRPGTHLVNVSRPDLIDQAALRECLDTGRIGRASLDVVDPEPLPRGHWMYSHPRICLSAHISWSSPTSQARIIAPFIENVKAFVDDRPLTGIVDTSAGY